MINGLSEAGHKLVGLLKGRRQFGVSNKSPTLSQLEQYFERFSLSDILPYRGYDPAKKIFYNEHSVGFVLETNPLVGCTEEMQREISGLFQHTLPEGVSIQFTLYADAHIKPLLDAWAAARNGHGEVFETLAKRRTDHLAASVFNNQEFAPLRNFRCFISFSKKGDLDNPVEEEKFFQLKDQIETNLKTLGLPIWSWDANELLTTLSGIVNFNETIEKEDIRWNPYNSLNEQIPLAGKSVQVLKDSLLLNEDEAHIRTYSVRHEPELWSLHAMGDLIGDSMRDLAQVTSPFILSYGIHIPDQEKIRGRIQKKESWVEKQARSRIGKKIPILVKQSRELDFVRHQQSKGERFVQTNFTIAVLSSPKNLETVDSKIKGIFRSKRWQIECDKYIQLPTFLSILPMAWGEGITEDLFYLNRLKTTLSTESANLLPLQGEWKGTPSKGLLLAGRRGQLFTWSPFDNDEGNYNVAVVGKSGSGKSVFMQELVSSTLGQGGQVFVLDVGRSFEKTVKHQKGEYIEFSPHRPICINPFTSIPEDDPEASLDALEMLKPIVSLMAAPKEGTNDLENTEIEKALKMAWQQKGSKTTMSDVANCLLENKDPIAQVLGKKLFPYTKDGVHGRFFEGEATVDLSKRMVIVEFEELKERKDLQSVILQMVIVQITNKLYLGDRSTPSNVVLDEAWDLLRGKQSGEFIETAARRFRKYNGSLVVGTQGVNDFYKTPAAQAAFENSDWMCLLGQKKESIAQLKNSGRLSMDPSMETLLKSVRTKQGTYAEVMIYGPHGYAVGRLLLDPYSLILYSTKAEEFTAVQRLVDQGLSLGDAIEEVSSRKAA